MQPSFLSYSLNLTWNSHHCSLFFDWNNLNLWFVFCLDDIKSRSHDKHVKLSSTSIHYIYSADDNKVLVTVWAKYLSATDKSFSFLSENGMVNRLCSYSLRNGLQKYLKKLLYQQEKYWTLNFQRVRINHSIFWKSLIKSFGCTKMFCANCVMSNFWHFNYHNSGSKHN